MADNSMNENLEDEILQEFLIESRENIDKLDTLFVNLESNPTDKEILSNIFRVVHTLKGTSGFFGLKNLEGISHFAEDILSKVRDGLFGASSDIVSAILEAVDHIKGILDHLEASKTEGEEDHLDIILKLKNISEAYTKKAQSGGQSDTKQAEPKKPKEEAEEAPVAQKESAEVEPPKQEESIAPVVKATPPPVVEVAPSPALQKQQTDISAPPKGADKATETVAPAHSLAENNIRVDTAVLDNLMNLAGELVLSRNRIMQIASKLDNSDLHNASQTMSIITTEMQEKIMKTRMQPIGNVFNKFPRVVRDLAKSSDKEIDLVLEGSETELDKTILEAIKDPLTHIVRNSADHGIETPEVRLKKGKTSNGTLTMRAYHQGGQVNIEIIDDGAGMDPRKIKAVAIDKGVISKERADSISDKDAIMLIFKPGFSTAEKITNISGRGVGMDVVRTNIEKLGGTVDVSSEINKGSVIKIKIPLTLAIIPALVVQCCNEKFAIPQVNLVELVRVRIDEMGNLIEKVGDAEFYRLRGEILPLIRLQDSLYLERVDGGEIYGISIVVLSGAGRQFGLIVDGIVDTEEIVVKPLNKHMKDIHFYAGATILGDGKVALILDVVNLADSVKLKGEDVDEFAHAEGVEFEDIQVGELHSLLLFNISEHEQFAVPLSLVSRLEKITTAQHIEIAGGKEVIRYRGASMPIIRLDNFLSISSAPYQEEAFIIVFELSDQNIGFYVSKIIDTVEIKINIDKETFDKNGLLGSSIIQSKVTLLLDVYAIIEMFDPTWFTRKRKSNLKGKKASTYRILVVEDSQFWRSMEQSYLEAEGYNVVAAENGEEGFEKLMSGHFDIVISDIDMPVMNGFQLVEKIRASEKLKHIPVVAVTALSDDEDKQKAYEVGVDNYVIKLDKGLMIEAIVNLLEKKNN
jgi:two-component system chemotaxis sensor kinase CheA